MASATEPKTLQEAILYFSDADNCLNYMVSRRWPNGVTCPTCGSPESRSPRPGILGKSFTRRMERFKAVELAGMEGSFPEERDWTDGIASIARTCPAP
jgi:hypothetical protein